MKPILEKAFEYIDGMNTSVSAPHPVDESRAKELLKFLKDEGVTFEGHEILAWGNRNGWDHGFTKKLAGWADKIHSGGRVVIKHPGYLSDELVKALRSLK
ncbi:DUF1889 family protein [Yersinia mollaretii]|uniref:DUF1889 family protein n=1 Tax=Yersinia mollaretii TaxID=33060 RepID=UPI001C94A910|nr:DUF1889 family protein [Yersinia mollaretii]